MSYPLDRDGARALDRADPLAPLRQEFHVPRRAGGAEEIYFCGNSLGLQPRRTAAYVHEELDAWRDLAVKAHFQAPHPWMPYHELLTAQMAQLVGARPGEVVTMNSLTVNLHLMMVSFYRPTAARHRILVEDHAFPSDRYAVESQLRLHGHDPAEALLTLRPRPGEELIRAEDLYRLIDEEGERIALILWPGVQYYTGQAFDLAEIARRGHARGAIVGFDLAHAAGNLALALHESGADFACWCTYKYLNSGPGSVGACFVHERHAERPDLARLAGWWGHDKPTRFLMGPEFRPIPGAEGWQLSNPPILSLAAIRAALDVFTEAGGMAPLRRKSLALTGYLEHLLERRLGDRIAILTPSDPAQRGCQLSIQIQPDRVRPGHVTGKELHRRIEAAGVTCDWREPNVIRVAPTPLYNRFEEVHDFVALLAEHLGS